MSILSLGDFRKGNLLFTLIVVGAVLVLMFIPDLIGISSSPLLEHSEQLSSSINFSETEEDEQEVEYDQESEALTAPLTYTNEQVDEQEDDVLPVSLADIESLLDTDYMDQLVEEKIAEKQKTVLKIEEEEIDPEEEDIRFSLNLPKLHTDRSGQGLVGRPPKELTWKFLQSKIVRRKFANLHRQATDIALDVDPKFQSSKYAMYEYASTIKGMADGSQRFTQPNEAIEYIEYLDRKVLTNMQREAADRQSIIKWSEISLEPIIGNRALNKSQFIPKIDPKLSILDFQIRTIDPGLINPNTAKDRLLYIKLSVIGKELSKITVLNDGKIVRGAFISPVIEDQQQRFVNFALLPIDGKMSFRVSDKYGKYIDYMYDFRPLIKLGTWVKLPRRSLYELKLPNALVKNPKNFQRYLVSGRKTKSRFNLFLQPGPKPFTIF